MLIPRACLLFAAAAAASCSALFFAGCDSDGTVAAPADAAPEVGEDVRVFDAPTFFDAVTPPGPEAGHDAAGDAPSQGDGPALDGPTTSETGADASDAGANDGALPGDGGADDGDAS